MELPTLVVLAVLGDGMLYAAGCVWFEETIAVFGSQALQGTVPAVDACTQATHPKGRYILYSILSTTCLPSVVDWEVRPAREPERHAIAHTFGSGGLVACSVWPR